MSRNLELHVVLTIGDDDTNTDAEIAAEVGSVLKDEGFAVEVVEVLPEGFRHE